MADEVLLTSYMTAMLGRWLIPQSRVVVPEYQPPKWSSCDVFRVTLDGQVVEYEVKRTPENYRGDRDKQVSVAGRRELKHRLLERGYAYGPNLFYFVLPDGMQSRVEVPKWAGVVVLKQDARSGLREDGLRRVCTVRVVKRAPVLHPILVDPAVELAAMSRMQAKVFDAIDA